jgi:hypothetical protein
MAVTVPVAAQSGTSAPQDKPADASSVVLATKPAGATPTQSPSPGLKNRTVSPAMATDLSARMPAYSPETPAQQLEAAQSDLRKIDKPRNKIPRLQELSVNDAGPPADIAMPNTAPNSNAGAITTMEPFLVSGSRERESAKAIEEEEKSKAAELFDPVAGGRLGAGSLGPLNIEVGLWKYDSLDPNSAHVGPNDFLHVLW